MFLRNADESDMPDRTPLRQYSGELQSVDQQETDSENGDVRTLTEGPSNQVPHRYWKDTVLLNPVEDEDDGTLCDSDEEVDK